MTPSMLDKLCCPFDKQDLEIKIITRDAAYNIIEGIMHCRSCNRKYPIIQGVAIMTPDEYRQPAIEQPVIKRLER